MIALPRVFIDRLRSTSLFEIGEDTTLSTLGSWVTRFAIATGAAGVLPQNVGNFVELDPVVQRQRGIERFRAAEVDQELRRTWGSISIH
jgi:hypothetical protein